MSSDVASEELLSRLVASALARTGICLFLTGAGVSAESGVPTFRGKQGYWVIGSRNYHAQELATRSAFAKMPEAVWGWYLHRLRVCRAARPNAAHTAIAELASALGDRFLLVTQNVDSLHARAGSPPERTYEVHGNISLMRCSAGCEGLVPVPEALIQSPEAQIQSPAWGSRAFDRALCLCVCGAWMRPHVLWFDEFYDERLFRFESSLRAADEAVLLVVVGTTGTTNLPLQIGERAARRRATLLVINPEPNPFSELARGLPEAAYLKGSAGHWVPRVARLIRSAS